MIELQYETSDLTSALIPMRDFFLKKLKVVINYTSDVKADII